MEKKKTSERRISSLKKVKRIENKIKESMLICLEKSTNKKTIHWKRIISKIA